MSLLLFVIISLIYLVISSIINVILDRHIPGPNQAISEEMEQRIIAYKVAKNLLLIACALGSAIGVLAIVFFAPALAWVPVLLGLLVFDGVALPMVVILTLILLRNESRRM